MAARDLTKRSQTNPHWRTSTTERLRVYARRMRSAPTEAENKLWSLVEDRRLAPHKFRRQVPVGRYIVDLMCPDRKLIIELDGSQHADNARDKERDSWLTEQGFRTLRVCNADMAGAPQ